MYRPGTRLPSGVPTSVRASGYYPISANSRRVCGARVAAAASYFLAQKWLFVKITSGRLANTGQTNAKKARRGTGRAVREMVLAVAVSR